MIALEARDITLRRQGRAIVRGVNLDLRTGEVLALVGPNGAGKSSLLRLLAGETAPDRGQILMHGRPLPAWRTTEIARHRAVVPQSVQLPFAFPVRDVVLMGRTPHIRGAESLHDLEVAEAALDRVDARHLADRSYTTLSGGEQQRIQIARALAQIWEPVGDTPRCLLLDEHTANLDLAHQHAMFALAREAAGAGIGVLAVVHDLNLASAYADRVAMLDNGRLEALGAVDQVLAPHRVEKVFGLACITIRHPIDDTPLLVAARGPSTDGTAPTIGRTE